MNKDTTFSLRDAHYNNIIKSWAALQEGLMLYKQCLNDHRPELGVIVMEGCSTLCLNIGVATSAIIALGLEDED